MMRIGDALRWVDRNHWSIPVATFALAELVLSVWNIGTDGPILLSGAQPAARQQIYASLSSTAGSLLGFSVASVAILAAFGPKDRKVDDLNPISERQLARARGYVAISLLTTAVFLLVLLIVSTVAIALDSTDSGHFAVTALAIGAGTASFAGLLVSGIGLALAVLERTG